MPSEVKLIAGSTPVLGGPPPPYVTRAETDVTGNDVVITFDRACDGLLIGDLSFRVRRDGVNLGFFLTATLDGTVATMHADATLITSGMVVTLDYVPPNPGRVLAVDNDAPLAPFAGLSVTNNVVE